MEKPAHNVAVVPLLAILLAVPGRPQVDDNWKRSNDHRNRYEGIINVLVGKPDLEVLSFLAYREPVTGYPDLRVGLFLHSGGTVSIKAVELEENRQYFMQAKEANWKPGAWNEFSPWPTKEVLGREEIPLSNVGVVIRLDRPGSDVFEFAPAFLYRMKAPVSVGRYEMYLRSHMPLKNLEFTWSQVVRGEEKTIGSSKAGEQMPMVPFSLKLNLESLTEGPVVISVEGKFKNQEGGPQHKYVFYHRPVAQ